MMNYDQPMTKAIQERIVKHCNMHVVEYLDKGSPARACQALPEPELIKVMLKGSHQSISDIVGEFDNTGKVNYIILNSKYLSNRLSKLDKFLYDD